MNMVLSMSDKNIYADNAATTRLSETAKNAMLPYFDALYANPSGAYSFAQKIRGDIKKARETVAAIIGAADSSEITFTSGGTEADNQAIISAAVFGAGKGKKHIVSTAFEHHAVLHTLDKLKEQGFEVTLVPPEKNGIVSTEKIGKAIRDDTVLVSVMCANNEIGTIQPISGIGSICHERRVLFHTDAVQAAGHIHIDVQKENIDLLSLSAHKFHGPKGSGVLYARKGIELNRILEGGGQEKNRRPGTENVPAIIGLAAALKEAAANIDNDTQYLLSLRERIISGLLLIPNTIINGDRESRLAGNINVSFSGVDGESLLLLLDNEGVIVSAGSACTASSARASHVLQAIDVPQNYIKGTLRITLSRYNTVEDADNIVSAVTRTVDYLRSHSPVWK